MGEAIKVLIVDDRASSYENMVKALSADHDVAVITNPQEALFRAADEEFDLVINIQGDEPLLYPEQLDQIIELLKKDDIEIATLCHPLRAEEHDNANIVKVAIDQHGVALGFSRDYQFITNVADDIYKHVGIYGFRSDVLSKVVTLKPSPNEVLEKLEQLRWLDHGYRIKVGITEFPNLSVDVPEDLNKILAVLKKNPAN